MAGVMVVYGPPITHLPPPAVGASPDAAIHDFKGSCRRSVRITVGRSLPWGRRRGANERGARAIRGTRRCEMEGGGDGGKARGGGGGGGGENGGTELSR